MKINTGIKIIYWLFITVIVLVVFWLVNELYYPLTTAKKIYTCHYYAYRHPQLESEGKMVIYEQLVIPYGNKFAEKYKNITTVEQCRDLYK